MTPPNQDLAKSLRSRSREICEALLDEHGIPKYSNGRNLWFSLRDEKHPSCELEGDVWNDFGGSPGGSCIDLAMRLLNTRDVGRAIAECARVIGMERQNGNGYSPMPRAPYRPKPPRAFTFQQPPDNDAFAARYGLKWTDFVAAGCKREAHAVGGAMQDCIMYPLVSRSGAMMRKWKTAARTVESNKRLPTAEVIPGKPFVDCMFGNPDRAKDGTLFITGGEEKRLAIEACGHIAVSLPNGEGNMSAEILDWLREVAPKKIVLAMDADVAGRKAVETLTIPLAAIAPVSSVQWTEADEGKDVNDLSPDERQGLLDAAAGAPPDPPDVPMPFPLEALPAWLQGFARTVSYFTETAPDAAACMALSVCSAAIAGKFIVNPWGRVFVPTNMWFLVAMESGERKGPVHSEAIRPVTEWQQESREAWRMEERTRQVKRASLEKTYKTCMKGASNGDAAAEMLAVGAKSALDALDVPGPPRVNLTDATAESLSIAMQASRERCAIISGEPNVLKVIAGLYTSQPNYTFLLNAYTGESVEVERVTRDPVSLVHPALTMGIFAQPVTLREFGAIPNGKDDGLFARFFYCIPSSKVGSRKGTYHRKVDEEAVESYRANVLRMFRSLPKDRGPERDEAHVLKYTDAALREIEAAGLAMEKRCDPKTGDLRHMIAWVAKWEGMVVRLSGVLHCAKYVAMGLNAPSPEVYQIEADTVRAAVRIGEYAIDHAVRAYRLMGIRAGV